MPASAGTLRVLVAKDSLLIDKFKPEKTWHTITVWCLMCTLKQLLKLKDSLLMMNFSNYEIFERPGQCFVFLISQNIGRPVDCVYRCTFKYLSEFLAELFCSLTANSLGTEVSCRRRADDVWMTREWDFIGDFSWWMTYVIRTSSACHLHIICTSSTGVYIVHMLSAGTYVIHTSSAELLMVSVDLNYLSTLTGSGYWMEFVARMLSCFISGSYKWFVR